MSIAITDASGNPVAITGAVGAPDQQISDSSGNIVNPSREDGNLLSIKTQTDKLTFSGALLQTTANLTATAVGLEDAGSVRINPAKEDGNLASILSDLNQFTFAATRLLVDGSGVTQPVSGTFWQATQPVSAAALPLPAGAATETTLASILTDANKLTFTATRLLIDGSGVTQPVSGPLTDAQLRASAVPVSGTFWQATQPVSGTVAATQSGTWTVQPGNTANTTAWLVTGAGGTFPITATSLPLPTGAATETTLAAIKTDADKFTFTSTRLLIDGSGVTQPVSGTFWQATQPISAASLPLPSGASTSAKQPALGTAGTASADVLTVQGIASMTALKVDGSAVTQPVSGTFFQATQPVSGTVAATQSGTWTMQPGNTANTTAWLVTGAGGTFPVTGTITANIGTSGSLALDATLAKLTIAQGAALGSNTQALAGGSVTTAAPTYTTGQISPLSLTTGGLLRVDPSGVTSPANISQWGGAATTLGQKAMASSVPVVIASDQTHFPVELQDGSGNNVGSQAIYGDQRLFVSAASYNTERCTDNGMYMMNADAFNLPTTGTETVAVFFKNPSGSGKTFSLRRLVVSLDATGSASATVKMYVNPTTSANGSAVTVSSANIGGGAAAGAATPFTAPTVSANGTRMMVFSIGSGADMGPFVYDFDGTVALGANNTILFTGTPSANNTTISFTLFWIET